MAFTPCPSDMKFVDGFLSDLRNISNEARKKHPAVKEASETAIVRLRNLTQNEKDVRQSIINHCLDLLQPILLAAESGNSKLVILGLQALQRLFVHEAVAEASFPVVLNFLWNMMENHVEELKLIQTITMILTSSNILHGEYLAKSIVICLRMHFSKDPVISNTAGAAIRQLVPLLFEKALEESRIENFHANGHESKTIARTINSTHVPSSLRRCGADAYALLQDLCYVMSGEQPIWLIGITEMTRVLALQLIESILISHRPLFEQKEFSFLLRERLCPLLIRLLSPCARHSKIITASSTSVSSPGLPVNEKPSFLVTVHLVRNVFVLLTQYCDILRPESEVFYSLLNKFVDSDRVPWLKILALEIFFKLFSDAKMVTLISQTYPTKAASEGVFGNIVNTINNYILAVFVRSSTPTSASPPSTPQNSATPASNPTFTHRDVNIQLFPIGKPILFESRDAEAPPTTDNYGMTLAFSSLCFISRTVLELLEKTISDGDKKGTLTNLVQNSWCGVLSAISSLLEASCDDSVTDGLLQVCRVYVRASGTVNLDIAREAFITALCKAAFPINYTIGILKTASSRLASYHGGTSSVLDWRATSDHPDGQNRNQIVAVGTPLSTSFQGAVMLTSKNITCLNTLLDITESMGDLLHGSWILVLASLQHLAWILGINQYSPGLTNALSRQRSRTAESGQNTILTNVLMTDLPELTRRFDEVFRHTGHLNDASLEHVVHALCKLSLDALEIAASTREPSIFAIAKLVDVSLVNMFRIETWWTVVTSNLLEVSANSNSILRDWGTDALTVLIKEGLEFDLKPPLVSNIDLQERILHPLIGLSKISRSDVRLKQFSCVHHVILSSAEKVSGNWKPIVEMIGAIEGIADEALIRAGFKCVQAIVSDHLRDISVSCIEQCAEVATKYGSQTLELNVSLTAIGVLWNIADYMYHNRMNLNVSQEQLIKFILGLYKQLSQLCLDVRPEVRKSAVQTLFLAVASHGSALDGTAWYRLITDICYTLLKCLDKHCSNASDERIGDEKEDKMMIHHSRDTAKKQWAETWAMVLPNVTKIILSNLPIVQKLKQPQLIWQGLLLYIQCGGLNPVEEVSMAAVRCLEDILIIGESIRSEDKNLVDFEISKSMWEEVWKAYMNIGTGVIESMRKTSNIENLRSQKWLIFYAGLFSRIYAQLGDQFSVEMFKKMHGVFPQILLPQLSKNSSKVLPCKAEISPLQEIVLENAECIQREILKPRSPSPHLITELYTLWQNYSRFSTSVPLISHAFSSDPGYLIKWWRATFSLFSENAMRRLTELYCETFSWKLVMDSDTLSNLIQALQQPLKLRETDAHQTAWRTAVQAILETVRVTIPTINAQTSTVYRNIWINLARDFDEFLYGEDNSSADWGTEEIDCEVATFFRTNILPLVTLVPSDDLKFVMMIFNKGSLHQCVLDNERSLPVGAEAFATICFESLLEFNLYHSHKLPDVESIHIPTILLRSEKVLSSLTPSSEPTASMRAQIALRCIESVLKSIKQTSLTNVDRQVWHDAIALYPKLVALVHVRWENLSSTIDDLLYCALMQYSSLIQPPFKL